MGNKAGKQGKNQDLKVDVPEQLVTANAKSPDQADKDEKMQKAGDQTAEDASSIVRKSTRRVFGDTAAADIIDALSFKQCKMVQSSWQRITHQHPNKIGTQLFIKFFLTYPEYRNFYPLLRMNGGSEMTDREKNREELRQLRDTAAMRHLAAVYIEALNTIFKNLEDFDQLLNNLDQLVDRHLPRGVYHLHFQDFASVLKDFVEEKSASHAPMSTTLKQAWTDSLKVINVIIDQRYLELQHKKYGGKSSNK